MVGIHSCFFFLRNARCTACNRLVLLQIYDVALCSNKPKALFGKKCHSQAPSIFVVITNISYVHFLKLL